MTRKLFLVAVLALIGLGAGSFVSNWAASAEKKKEKRTAAPYVHVVIFHVKKDAPDGAAEGLIADAHELLAKIPTVRSIRAGRPDEKSSGKFVKKDYQVALAITFDNYDGMKTYLDHEMHLEYVKRHVKNLDEDKLTVYDFVNQKK